MRLLFAWSLTILASACFFISALFATKAIVLADPLANWRLLVIAGAGLLFLVVSARLLRDTSIIWQIPLQSFAAATASTGAVVLVDAAFDDWHLLLGKIGFLALLSIAVGFGAGWVMRRLQLRLLPRQDA